MGETVHKFLGYAPPAATGFAVTVATLGGEAVRTEIWQGVTAVAADPVGAPVAGAVTLAWGAAWWLTRAKSTAHSSSTMPLYRAVRWLVQDSQWAAEYPSEDDNDWILRADRMLQSALSMGKLRAWGYHKPRLGEADPGISEIPPDFWRRAQWNSHHMVGCEPPTHIWRDSADGGGQYRRVVIDEAAVKSIWPKRSRWAAFKGRSPIERLSKASRLNGKDGYEAIWGAQDAHYRRIENREPYGAFGAMFDSSTPSILDDD